jgi:hypothetical protein
MSGNEEIVLVYRKSVTGKWRCSWNCGFEHHDIEKVTEHENKKHGGKNERAMSRVSEERGKREFKPTFENARALVL